MRLEGQNYSSSTNLWKNSRMINPLEFINSKDIADYLEKQEYPFSPMETAWLIYRNLNHSMKQKHEAYKQLIADTEDFEVKGRYENDEGYNSFHKLLTDLMKENDYLIEMFFSNEENTVYRVGNYYFSSATKAMKDAQVYGEDLIWIEKHYLDQQCYIKLMVDGFNNIYDCKGFLKYNESPIIKECIPHLLSIMPMVGFDFLESNYYSFPVPFKENNIVCTVERPWQSLVLLEDIKVKKSDRYLDETDMDYLYRENFDFYDKTKYHNHGINYMNLQYYKEEK